MEFDITSSATQRASDRKSIEYYKVNDDTLKAGFVKKVLYDVSQVVDIDIEGIEEAIKNSADLVLKRKYITYGKREGGMNQYGRQGR